MGGVNCCGNVGLGEREFQKGSNSLTSRSPQERSPSLSARLSSLMAFFVIAHMQNCVNSEKAAVLPTIQNRVVTDVLGDQGHTTYYILHKDIL